MTRPMNEYKAWLIDLDGTLYRARAVRCAMAAELLLGNWRSLALLRTFRCEHERLRHEQHEPVASPYALQLERAAAKAKVSVADLEALVQKWMIDRPGKWLSLFRRSSLLRQIEQYRAQGGQTALVSDYPASRKLQALNARDLFHVVVANGEPQGPQRLKPWPDGYQLAAERLGVPANACLVIGDRDDADGEAANRAGMAFRKIG